MTLKPEDGAADQFPNYLMRHFLASRGLWLMFWLVMTPAALAFREPARELLPDFDKRPQGSRRTVTAEQRAAADNLGRQVGGVNVRFDDALGRVRHVHSATGFLSGPTGVGKGIQSGAAAAFPADDPHRPVKAFLDSHSPLFGHGAEALRGARVERDYTTRHNGMRTVVWQQTVDGIPVYEGLLVGHTTSRGELAALSSQFLPDADRVATASVPHRAALAASPTITVREAIARAGENVGEVVDRAKLAFSHSAGVGPTARHKFAGGNLRGTTDAKLVWLPMDKGSLRLCWEVILSKRGNGGMYRVLVDAEAGDVMLRQCLTSQLTEAMFRVFTSDSPSPFSPGSAAPSSYQPPVTNRELVSMLAVINTNASRNGWINDGVFETLGNNVDAHLDRNGDDAPDLPRPTATNRVFDFPQDLASAPTDAGNQASAVVQLFYWCNWVHDRLYELGFTEAAGNFQTDNFGNGGTGNDAVQADAQDGSGSDNADFSTPPDGLAPRMQMFLFPGPTPDRDGDLDAEIVIHEYVHGLTSRRVGNGVGISAAQTQGMGEGWSDFYALALLSQATDALGGNYPMAAYAAYFLNGSFEQNYYYGIRRYPYSTNLAANPLTLKDIDPTRADPHAGVPRSPARGNSATEVHNLGEVWGVTLWEVRANLINKHGYAVGNQLSLRLVTDALALSPANPTFLEARDAILQADFINNAGANQLELWRAFAKRGMGASAIVPINTTTVGVQEAYDLPDDLRVTPNSGLTSSGALGGPFNPGTKTYMVTNYGTNLISWTVGASGNWLAIAPTNGMLVPSGTTNVVVSLTPATLMFPTGVYTNVVTFTNLANGATQAREFILAVGQPDYFTEFFDGLDNDLAFQSVTFSPDGSSSYYNACRVATNAFPVNPAGGISLSLTDDSRTFITLTNGAQVSPYGTNFGGLYVGSNGYLTFDSGDSQYFDTLANHFNRIRVSGLFLDLLPDSQSTISWKQLSDRVAVTWQNIREYNTANRNNFQIELFFDGRVRITYLAVTSRHGIAGLSRGKGVPPGFVESDLSQYPTCLPPLIVTLPASIDESAGRLLGSGSVSIGLVMTNDVVVQLAASDTSELSVTNVVTIPAGQTNVAFDLVAIDDAVLDGPQKVYVMATALGFPSGAGCLMVNDNETAALAVALPASALENIGVLANQGTVSLSAPPVNAVTVALTSSNPKLQIPLSLAVPAGQTSAVFSLTVVDNNFVDGTQTAVVTAHVANWGDGSGVLTIFDDETSYNYVDHFKLGSVAVTQYAGASFGLTITAKTPVDDVFTNFTGAVSLYGLRALASNEPVQVLAYVGHADVNVAYSNTVAAISSVGTNYAIATTTATNPAALRDELASRQVFLVPEQANAAPGLLGQLGAAWSNVLRDFTARGGVVIVCSTVFEEYRLLTESGLMDLQRTVGASNATVQILVTNALTASLSNSFSVTNAPLYLSSNATAVIGISPGNAFIVAMANLGLGRAILLGTGFVPLGSPLDRVAGNAVKSAQTAAFQNFPVTPSGISNFVGGVSATSVVVHQAVSNLFLAVVDELGHFGIGNFFSVTINHAPVASNLSFVIHADSATNLSLTAFDLDGQPLAYSITALPTNGLLGQVFSTNGLFRYTPAHAFTGNDSFAYTAGDGISNSVPAWVSVTVLPLSDSNSNGIPDTWEQFYGLSLNPNSASLDFDGDGLVNFQEYLAGSNPNDSQSGPLNPEIVRLANGHYQVSWRSIGGVRYRLQVGDGDALGNYDGSFIDIVRPAWLEIDPAAVGVPSTNTFLDDFSIAGPPPVHGTRYYRIKSVR